MLASMGIGALGTILLIVLVLALILFFVRRV